MTGREKTLGELLASAQVLEHAQRVERLRIVETGPDPQAPRQAGDA